MQALAQGCKHHVYKAHYCIIWVPPKKRSQACASQHQNGKMHCDTHKGTRQAVQSNREKGLKSFVKEKKQATKNHIFIL